MANPRNIVRWQGIAYSAQTFHIDDSTITYDRDEENGSAQVGLAVMLSAAGTVALTSDGALVLGKLLKVESDGKATVQTGGYVDLPGGDGATLTLGSKIVGDLGAANARGYIRAVATGTAAELGVARGIIVDAATPAETWVRFE